MKKAVIYLQDGHTFIDLYMVYDTDKEQIYKSYYAKNDEVLRILLEEDIKPDIVVDKRFMNGEELVNMLNNMEHELEITEERKDIEYDNSKTR